ncbi:hypothetical protein B0T14DRAFT_551515 [Immersiella caudata]|uniref:Uncharacterized protein n=1 Tax=Immersiella caudata TaxID=314043 RepID=A0AA39X3L8_9PEZI|nr:hypothetical protein B0T14DRAFT_551515 [Immersiella caudata]
MASQPPNINDIFNRINMGMSQRSKILSSLNRPSTTSNSSAITTNTSSNTTTKGKSFSSLTSKTPTPTNKSHSQTPPSADSDADLKTSYLLPPNAGVGFAPTPSASSATAEQKALRERLGKVGWKGGKRGEKDGGKGKKRVVEQSESEEELGRSAVGKSRGKEKGKRVRSDDGGELSAVVEGGKKEMAGVEVLVLAEEGKEDVEMVTVTENTPVSGSGEMPQPDGEGKAKKKKQKKGKDKGKKETESTGS